MEIWFKSTGIIRYGPGLKAVVTVDQGISNFYRSMIPKWIKVQPQMYPAHISFVRRETPPNMEFWGKYEGERIEFEYSNIVVNDDTYFWLNARSIRLPEIRSELGLTPFPSWRNKYHITISNCKEPGWKWTPKEKREA